MPKLDVCVYVALSVCVSTHTHTHTKSKLSLVLCTNLSSINDLNALLDNSAITGMVDVSTRLKELLVLRVYVRSRLTKVRGVG